MMRSLLKFLAAFGIMISSYHTVLARSPEQTERLALVSILSDYEKAVSRKDMIAVFDALPPRVFSYMAEKNGLSPQKLRTLVAKLTEKLSASLVDFEMREDEIEFRELADGTPYALIPTTTIVKAGDGSSVRSVSHTLAVLDGSKWYLLRVNDVQQMKILQAVYPDFTGVEFPRGTMETLKD